MLDRIKKEPAIVAGIVQAVLGLLLAFGVSLSTEQTGAILAITAAILALFVRSQVTPTTDGDAGEHGAVDTLVLIAVLILVGVALLLFGVKLG